LPPIIVGTKATITTWPSTRPQTERAKARPARLIYKQSFD